MTIILVQNIRRVAIAAAVTTAAFAGGCANDGGTGGLFSTGSIGTAAPVAVAAVDPACTTLASQIDETE